LSSGIPSAAIDVATVGTPNADASKILFFIPEPETNEEILTSHPTIYSLISSTYPVIITSLLFLYFKTSFGGLGPTIKNFKFFYFCF